MTKEIKIKKNTLMKGAIIVLTILLLVSIITEGFTFNSTCEVVKDTNQQPTQAPSVNMKQLVEEDSVKGDLNAPITIVEFSDYECSFCAKFYSETYSQLKEEYIDTGKVKLIFRDFPLSFHQNAQKAAEAAECAGEQGKYYEMHDKLFDSFKQYAKELDLNTNTFDICLDSNQMASEVQKDMRDGQSAGVRGTPAFFINGELITGAQPYSVFKQKIDSLL